MIEKAPIMFLKLVMLPDSLYPLHIFEERFKKMINECILENMEFGIVAEIDNQNTDVGCLVKVSKIIQVYEDESFDIIVSGTSRFFVKDIGEHTDGYPTASIREFYDDEYILEQSLYLRTVGKLKEVLDKTNLQLDESFWKNLETAKFKSFKIAEKAGLNLKQRQEIILMRNENTRLYYLYNHLDKIIRYIDQDKTIKLLVASDGFLN